jgi:hypothetical protein
MYPGIKKKISGSLTTGPKTTLANFRLNNPYPINTSAAEVVAIIPFWC